MKHIRIGLWLSFLIPLFLFLLVPQLPAQEVGREALTKYGEARKLYSRGEYEEALQIFEELSGKNLGFWRNRRVRSYIAAIKKRKAKEDKAAARAAAKTKAKKDKAAARAAAKTKAKEEKRSVTKPVPKFVAPEIEDPALKKGRAFAILEREKQLEKIASGRARFLSEHHVKVGKNFYEKLDYEKARAEFQTALTMDPKSEDALLYLEKCNAMLDIRKARIPEFARREFDLNKARIERARLEMERMYQEGKRLLKDGNFKKAIAKFMSVREIVHWMPYKEDVSEYDRGTTELIEQAKAAQKRHKEEMDRVKREEAVQALAGEIDLEKEYKQQKVQRLMDQAVEFRRMQKYEKAMKLYDEILVLEPEDFRATIGKMDCQINLLKKQKGNIEEEKDLETEKAWLENDMMAIPQTDIVKKPDNWEIIRKRTIPRFGRAVTPPTWRPPLEEALGTKKVSIFFTETPLSQVLQFLGDLTEIDFVADLEEEEEDPLITIRVNSMTLRNALNWIATLSGTRWGLKNEAVYFGMRSVEESSLRFYPIRDLMYEPTDFPGSGFTISGADDAGGFELEAAIEEETRFDAQMLIDFIKNIDAESWDEMDEESNNKIEYHAGMLLIINTPEVHQKVEDLLAHFRATRGLQVCIYSQFIELQDNFLEDLGIDLRGLTGGSITEVADSGGTDSGILGERGTDTDWRLRIEHLPDANVGADQTASGGLGLSLSILDDIQVKMILRAVQKKSVGNILVAPKLTCFDGQRANVTVAEQISYVSDYEVETGGEGAVGASPEIEQALDGVSLDVRPIVSADRRFITIEVRPSLARLKRPFRSVDVSLGYGMTAPIDLPEAALKTVQTTVMIPDGGTILMGGLMDRSELEHNISVPFLSKIPILNNFFRKKAKGIEKRNLILLIRGKIVSLDESLGGSI